jgi:hypothetical protein
MYNSGNHRWRKARFLFFPLFILFAFALSAVVMFLWNAILPEVVNVTPITYWQAMGLLILCRILFGGFKFGPRHSPPYGRPEWKEKLMNMTEEEREKFKQQWRERCGPK